MNIIYIGHLWSLFLGLLVLLSKLDGKILTSQFVLYMDHLFNFSCLIGCRCAAKAESMIPKLNCVPHHRPPLAIKVYTLFQSIYTHSM